MEFYPLFTLLIFVALKEVLSVPVAQAKPAADTKGKAIKQLLDGNNVDNTDETAALGNTDGIPAAIEDETNFTDPNPPWETAKDVPMLLTEEIKNGYTVDDESSNDEKEMQNDDQTLGLGITSDSSDNSSPINTDSSDAEPIDKISSLDVAGILASNDDVNDIEETSNPGNMPNDVQDDISVNDDADVNPSSLIDALDDSVTSNNINDETQADTKSQESVDNGYFVSEPWSTGDNTEKAEKAAKAKRSNDLTADPAVSNPKEEPANLIESAAPRNTDESIILHDNSRRDWKK